MRYTHTMAHSHYHLLVYVRSDAAPEVRTELARVVQAVGPPSRDRPGGVAFGDFIARIASRLKG